MNKGPALSKLTETAEVWDILRLVHDPEVPVLNVVEMGIVRAVLIDERKVEVAITPTYSGCPAMDVIGQEIQTILKQHNFHNITIRQVLLPPWTTDWLTDEARQKLEQYGIAPPEHTTAEKAMLSGQGKEVRCPRCKSLHTRMVSNFGSTACKALWQCEDCKEPFDYFKCI